MTPRIKRIYKSACKNKEFLRAIEEADGDKKPTMFAPDLEKHIFATIYYGWLVSQYGCAWELHL